MTEKRKENPQRALSKNLIVHALMNLMKEKPYKEIKVTELAQRADLSRRTFYRHFATIDEVLDFTLQQISEQYRCYQTEQNPTDLKSVIYIYFLYFEKRKDFLFTLHKNGLLYLLLQKVRPVPNSNKATALLSEDTTNALIEYAICFSIGAIGSLLEKWIETGATYSAKEMADITEKILQHLK